MAQGQFLRNRAKLRGKRKTTSLREIRRLPEWEQEHLTILRYSGWPWYRIRTVLDYIQRPLSRSQQGILVDITYFLGQMLIAKKKKDDKSYHQRQIQYFDSMHRALAAGLRQHPLVYEFVTVHQIFGGKFDAREPIEGKRRRLKRDAARRMSPEEKELYCEIQMLIKVRALRTWQQIWEKLLVNKDRHPWGHLLKGKTKQSFHTLRHRLGFTNSSPRFSTR